MNHDTAIHGVERMRTGIEGFDAIADGGLPRGGITVVLGGPGAGKTIFAMQVVATGARDAGEPGIVVAFEESPGRIVANTASFAWGGAALARNGVFVLDAQLSQSIEQGGAFDLVGFLAIVEAKAAQIGAKRIVFDGLDVLLGYLGDASLVRREVLRLRDWVHRSGLSAIVTAKTSVSDAGLARDYEFLEFMADCVVTLHHRVVHGTAVRFVRVSKYRGASHSANEFPLTIVAAGMEVAADTTIELAYPASTERISSGIERLDAMLAGGYHRGSSVLISGVPGTAKTTLAAAFAEAAARRGERTTYLSFDEAPEQIVRNMASIGIDLGQHVASGVLRIQALRARSASPEAHAARLRAWLHDDPPRNLVIDPLSALTHPALETGEGAALDLIEAAKRAGVTVVSTSLLDGAQPLTEHTPLNISTIADVWMHVSYVKQGGERNRALTIIKARGTGHSNQVRELVLTASGVTLADVYAVRGEVLMGTLRWEKENEARRERATAKTKAALGVQRAELALAETQARLDTLVRQQAIQQAELVGVEASVAEDAEYRAVETGELLQRRHADPETPSYGPTPLEATRRAP